MNNTDLQGRWRDMMDAKLRNIRTLKELEKGDPNIEVIMATLRELYSYKLDSVDENTLLRIGGDLLGSFASAGVTCSLKRAERDAAEQSYDELLASMITFNRGDDVGITEARSLAKEQMGEFGTEIIWREQVKNAYEAIVEATEKTISFIQSAIKIKNSDRVATARLGNEVGYDENKPKKQF